MANDPNPGQPFPPQYGNPQTPGPQPPYGQPPQYPPYPPQGQYPPPGSYPPQGNQGYPPPAQQYSPAGYAPQANYPPQGAYPAYGAGPGAPGNRPSHTGRNVLLALLAVVLLGGIGFGYWRHTQEQKRSAAWDKQMLSDDAPVVAQNDPTLGDGDKAVAASGPCSFLSAAEVSGLTPDHRHVDAVADQDDCNYQVTGSADALQGVHMAMLMKSHGLNLGDTAAQPAVAATGTATLFTLSYLAQGGGAAFNELKAKVAAGQLENLPGLGDQAWNGSDTVTSVLKGDKVLVLNYINCPCLGKDVKPLAVKAAAKL